MFPLLIAVGMAAILCTVVLMTHENETPESLVAALKKSPPSKRWQKAFELSNELNRHPKSAESHAISRELLDILRDGENFDAKTRGYTALALSHNKSDETFNALVNALGDPEEEVRVYALWSLGLLGRKEAAGSVAKQIQEDSPEIRKTAAYVLGVLGSEDALPILKQSLQDPAVDVRWNAALALARLGDEEGHAILMSMLERERLSNVMKMDEAQIENTMVNATRGLALIPRPESIKILQLISKEDRNMHVRQASLDSLKQIEKSLS